MPSDVFDLTGRDNRSSTPASFEFVSCSLDDSGRLTVVIAGQPKSKPRPGQGKAGNRYNPAASKERQFAEQVSSGIHRTLGDLQKYDADALLSAHFTFCFERAKHGDVRRQLINTADTDNLVKFTMDALARILYPNDKQVIEVSASKRVSAPGGSSYTKVTFRELDLHDVA